MNGGSGPGRYYDGRLGRMLRQVLGMNGGSGHGRYYDGRLGRMLRLVLAVTALIILDEIQRDV